MILISNSVVIRFRAEAGAPPPLPPGLVRPLRGVGGASILGRPVANHGENTLTMAHEALASVMEGRVPFPSVQYAGYWAEANLDFSPT